MGIFTTRQSSVRLLSQILLVYYNTEQKIRIEPNQLKSKHIFIPLGLGSLFSVTNLLNFAI